MISFCCPFYPWYREHDRTSEIFDVLIRGLNNIHGVEDLELSFINAGVVDVWRTREKDDARSINSDYLEERMNKEFKGKIKYLFDKKSIHTDEGGTIRFWCSNAIQRSVDMSSNDYIIITGIDIYFTKYFVSDYFERVNKSESWVVFATDCKNVGDIEHIETGNLVRNHYAARGIVGILRNDFYKVGGYDCSYIKDRSDSDFYDRLKDSDINITEEKVDSIYHVWHPGTHMTFAKIGLRD